MMKHILFMAACAASLAGNASASATAASTAHDMKTNRDVGVASSSCPALKVTDPVVALAVAPAGARDLNPFPAHLNGAVWQVSRDGKE
ncbi:MAG: hypothetical protein C0514_09010 [Candidatus Puniceispirillum sp.]|nr:hypothetical protein [Candidatus Puniceispirillum sp.]